MSTATDSAPTVDEARTREEEAHAHVDELIRLVETGEDLSANDRIPAAKDAAESATRLRKGVEQQARKRQYEAWVARWEEFRREAVASRNGSDDDVAEAYEAAVEGASAWVSELSASNAESVRLSQGVHQLRSEAETLDGFPTDGRLNTVDSLVRGEKSVVGAVAELFVRVLRPVADGPLTFREQQLYEVVKAYTENDSATVGQLLRNNVPGRLGER